MLYGDRADGKLPEGRTYIQDLLGCLVIDADSGAEYGTIADVQNYGSCDIYDVQKGKAHTLVPPLTMWWWRKM